MTVTPVAPPTRRPAGPPPTAPANGNHNGPGTAPAISAPSFSRGPVALPPPRILLNAVEGWGKTSCGAYAPEPAILMARGETGYETLLGAGSVPDVDRVKVNTWPELLAIIDGVTNHKTIVLDAMGGMERLCHEFVCQRDFGNDWGERGFASYQKGYDVAVTDWLILLAKLDRIRDAQGVNILFLSHCRIKTFKNPMGADFDRYVSDVHDKTWGATAKWADAVLFGNYVSVVEGGKTGEKPKKGKGVGGTMRILYTQRRDAFDAKNRYGMLELIDIPDDPATIWSTLWAAIQPQKAK